MLLIYEGGGHEPLPDLRMCACVCICQAVCLSVSSFAVLLACVCLYCGFMCVVCMNCGSLTL